MKNPRYFHLYCFKFASNDCRFFNILILAKVLSSITPVICFGNFEYSDAYFLPILFNQQNKRNEEKKMKLREISCKSRTFRFVLFREYNGEVWV